MKRSILAAAIAATAALPAYAQTAEPTAPAATQGVTVYPPEFFAESRPNTAMDMINRLPGFAFDGGDQVRGFAGAAGNVLIDGRRPGTKADALSDVLTRINAADVERIEVIRGGAPGVDMQGRAVIANVVRKKADSFQQTMAIGSHVFFGTGKLMPGFRYEVTKRTGDTTLEASLVRAVGMDDSVGDGVLTLRDGSGAVTQRQQAFTEGDGGPMSAKGSIKTPLYGGEFRANATFATNDFKGEDHYFTDTTKTDVVGKDSGYSGEIGINYDRPLSERFSLETLALQKLGTASYRQRAEEGANQGFFTSEADTGESIVRAELKFEKSPTLTFEGGGEAAFNFREGDVSYVLNGAPVDLGPPHVRAEERRGEIFGQASWRPTDKLSFEAGARFESSTISSVSSGGTTGDVIELEKSFFYPKPRALMTWSPNPQNQLRLRVEREVGQLNFGDFSASADLAASGNQSAGNASLVPDKTWVYEAAYERRFWGDGALVLTLRHEQITDAIDRKPVFVDIDTDGDGVADTTEVFDAPGNIGDGTNTRLDVNLTVPLERLRVKGGELKVEYSVSHSEVTDPTTGETRRISGQRPQSTEVSFRQDLPDLKLTWGLNFFGGWEETYYQFNQVEHFEIWNFYSAFVEYKPTPKTSLLFEVSNLDPFQFEREWVHYDAPRDTGAVDEILTLETQSQLRAYVRLRRTF